MDGALALSLKLSKSWNNLDFFLLHIGKNKKKYDKKTLFWDHDALRIYGAPKLCTKTTLSNHPVVLPKSSCDVHLFRGPCLPPCLSLIFFSFFSDWAIRLSQFRNWKDSWSNVSHIKNLHSCQCLPYLCSVVVIKKKIFC